MLDLFFNVILILLFIDVGVTSFLVIMITRQMLKDFPSYDPDYELFIDKIAFVGFCFIPMILLIIIFFLFLITFRIVTV